MENRELKEALGIYKQDTLKLIASLENNDFNALEVLVNKRQQTIDNINELEYTHQEFSEIAEELQILIYQKKLSDLMLRKREETRGELNRISNAKNASNMYNKRMYSNSMVFNKTI